MVTWMPDGRIPGLPRDAQRGLADSALYRLPDFDLDGKGFLVPEAGNLLFLPSQTQPSQSLGSGASTVTNLTLIDGEDSCCIVFVLASNRAPYLLYILPPSTLRYLYGFDLIPQGLGFLPPPRCPKPLTVFVPMIVAR